MDIRDACEQAFKNGYAAGVSDGYEKGIQSGSTIEDSMADVYIIGDCDCVSNAKVFGLNESVRRAKYPMSTNLESLNHELTNGIMSLAQSGTGEGHDQFLTGIIVQFDLTFTNKAWVEAERYHFLDFVSSQSTMHRIAKFDLDKSYDSHVDPRIIEIMKEKVAEYNDLIANEAPEEEKKEKYIEILYNNPAGFKITAGMTTNYRQLKTIYKQRRNHRLYEWRAFCTWIETLPHSELITGKKL